MRVWINLARTPAPSARGKSRAPAISFAAGYLRDPHLRPHVVGPQRGLVGPRCRPPANSRGGARSVQTPVAGRMVAALRLEPPGRRAALPGVGQDRRSQGGNPRRLRLETLEIGRAHG